MTPRHRAQITQWMRALAAAVGPRGPSLLDHGFAASRLPPQLALPAPPVDAARAGEIAAMGGPPVFQTLTGELPRPPLPGILGLPGFPGFRPPTPKPAGPPPLPQ